MLRLFHECIDNEEWRLTTPFAPHQCAERLRAVLRSSFVEVGLTDQLTAEFTGSVGEGFFRMTIGREGAALVAAGYLSPSPSGTTIALKITHTSEGWFLAVVLVVFLLVTLIIGLPAPGIGHALLTLLATAGVIAVPMYWAWEKKRLVDFIGATLQTDPQHMAFAGLSTDW